LFVEAWRVMEGIYAEGRVRAIGVSNFMQDQLDTLLTETTVVPAVNQIELHPTFQQAAVSAGSRAAGVAVEAYSPLGRGSDLEVVAVTELASEHGVTPAQIVLAWHLGVGNIVIPKTMHVDRMRENLAAAEVTLTQAELDTVTALDSSARIGSDPAEAAFTQM
jgi:2,5-diketo-D-gluconate reductase A